MRRFFLFLVLCLLATGSSAFTTSAKCATADEKPSGRLIFSQNNHAKSARVDVLDDGSIQWVAGGKDHGWISLSGIVYAKSSRHLLSLSNGWEHYSGTNGYWAPAEYSCADGLVVVSGLVKNGNWGDIGTLPSGCRPKHNLIFSMDNHENQARVDVYTDGRISWVAGGRDHSWISLSGIVFSTTDASLLPLSNGWQHYSGTNGYWAPAEYSCADGLVVVSGLVKNGNWGDIGTLPSGCRPKHNLIFSMNNHENQARVDVYTDGRISWVAGGTGHSWISLSGIVFSTTDASLLPLSNGWQHYSGTNGYWAPAEYASARGLTVVQGLIKNGNWGSNMGHIPHSLSDCAFAPDNNLIFSVNNHAKSARVDVYKDGRIEWEAGGQDHGWISLSGIVYKNDGRNVLPLRNGWQHYSGTNGYWAPAEYSCADGLVVVSGLVKNGNWGDIGTLPSGCRPKHNLIFSMDNHENQARVDVYTDGRISWVAGGRDHSWISLSGIVFSTTDASLLPLSNGWQHYSGTNGYWAPAEYSCADGLVVVSGLVKNGNWGDIGTLPSGCRPKHNLIFSMNNHENQARVDVYTDGRISWVAGGTGHSWISLSGIVFSTTDASLLPLSNGWQHYSGTSGYWAPAEYASARGLTVVQGLIKNGNWGSNMGNLPLSPPDCALVPSQNLIYSMNNHAKSARVDVYTDGGIKWIAGGQDHGWISLSGVVFSAWTKNFLPLRNGWQHYSGTNGYWAPAEYSCADGLVVVSGLVKNGNWGDIGTLPSGCRPKHNLIFSMDNHENQARVDVYTDGRISWVAGGRDHSWISLSGIVFSTTDASLLPLSNGWEHYSGTNGYWAPAEYSCADGLVVVSGLVKNGNWGDIGTLPSGCRPKHNLIFSMDNHENQARVDVYTDGRISWVAGGRDHSWISLSGIVFSTTDASLLPLSNGWQHYSGTNGYWAPATLECVRGLTVVQGLIKNGNWGSEMARLLIPAPPPSPPPPSPPPPSPPPPGEFTEVRVSIGNPVSLVSAYSFDFDIKVAHDSCSTNADDCFESSDGRETTREEDGLRCEVRVTRRGTTCDKYTNHMPCRAWDDFFPQTLEMTNDEGRIVDGTYDVKYSCFFVLSDGTRVSLPKGDEKTLHTFELRSGCADVMPHGRNRNLENLARQLLLTSDEFNVADCRNQTQVYKAKETVFRRYDNDPEDGVLSYDEILSALQAQSADVFAVSIWNDGLDGKLELKPMHVMRVETNDMECGTGSIVYDSTVYPSDSPGRESTLQQCRGDATFMQVSWHYNAKLTAGDYMCLYADGMLYDKLSVFMSDPKVEGYSKVNGGLYAATEFTDIRPVSGTFEDVQESLVANFLFDGDELISASPRVSGQQGGRPKLVPVDTVRDIKTCTGGNGGLCLSAVPASSASLKQQFGYAYTSDEVFADDMAMSAWIYRKCGTASASDIRRTSIAYFTGENGGMSHELRFYLDSSMSLKLEYARDDSVSSSDSLTLSGLACGTWHYVGFSLNKRDKMVLFANPTGAVEDMSDTSTFKTAGDMDPDTPRKLLSVMTTFEMLGAVDVEFDDVRVYRGQVSRATFLDAYRCGHRPLCAKRAHVTPASRRVVCASAVIAMKSEETYSDYFCTAAMYYDGAAIDVSAMLDTAGVTFTYRDTSWEESSFEMLRKPVGREFSSASYETIIQMDGDLKGCVNKFSSISYLDREAGNKPNLEWYYKVRTKMASASSSDLVSTTHYFKAPWIGTLEGTVTAGSSGTPVAHVRVCADFIWPNGTAMSSTLHKSSSDLALYMRATHSSDMSRTASEKTYVVTDGAPDPRSGSSSLNPGEYVRIELARWSSIERVEVCMSGKVSSSQRLRAYVQDYDSGDSGNHGHECTFYAELTTSHAQHTCMFYDCVGSELTSFHGKFINVVRDGESSSEEASYEIPATGLYSWFKSSEASKEWKSEVNGFVGTVISGNVKTEFHSGNGAAGVVRTLAGDRNAQFNFGAILPAEWTLCTLSRYTRSSKGRILIGGNGNFLHGHHSNKRGVAYYDGWTNSQSRGTLTDWLVMCGTNKGQRAYVDGVNVATADRNGASGNKHLGINYAPNGGCCDGERSDWAVAEVITWDRSLSDDEMKQVSGYLDDVKSAISVSEISAVGTRTNCRFSAVSDADGAYEIKLRDTSGKIPVNAKMLGAAYKEEIFPKTIKKVIDSADTSSPTSQPAKVLLILRERDAASTSALGQSPDEFKSWDDDNSTALEFDEFSAFVEDAAHLPLKGHAIISRAIWDTLDVDGDETLSSSEFADARAKMNSGQLVADPILVYASINAKYLSSFVTMRHEAASCENFILARTNSSAMPSNTTAWNAFYEGLVQSGSSLSSMISPCATEEQVEAIYAGGNDMMTKLIPLRVFGAASKSMSLAADGSPSSLNDDLTRFGDPVILSATEQYHDIVHIFDKTQKPSSKDASQIFEHAFDDLSEIEDNVFKIRHRGEMQLNFADETAAIVRGAVLFPKDWTAGSTTCGLFEATIEVSELNQQGEPEKFTTDESGWFEMALTRGKSYVFNATFPKHTICYTGRTIADAADAINCDGASQTATLNRVGDGNYIFFTDVTRGNIDLGVYHGQCESQYSGARFKVTPINGCHPPVYVDSAEINRLGDLPGGAAYWSKQVKNLPEGEFDDNNPLPDNARVWPFAAMDYSILLDSGPSVGGIGDLIAVETWKDGCATEDGDMVTFFRRRNALERLALMRDDNDWQQIRYKYHGYVCVDIPDAYIPKINDDDDKCYDPAEPNGGLTSKHFLGSSTSSENPLSALLSIEKSIRMKVFELHVMADGTYKKCFEKLPNENDGTGSTKIKIRQDVSNAEDSECHPDRGGGASCDFQVTIDTEGYLQFPESGSEMTISAGFPNLAGNHRRTVRVEVERNDLYRSVTAIAIRELVPLGSKPRGGDGLSDDTFWATVPLDGLVYTVVHDPPGGNSYAELLSGTEFRIEYEITGMRAMTAKGGTYLDSHAGVIGNGEFGMNFGYTAEGSGKITQIETHVGGQGSAVIDGPNFKVESTMANGWDIVMTMDRAVRSSQDPALPGRAGDTILGGGIELVYKMSDILDLSDPKGGVVVCLDVQSQVTWLPRKPTTYVFAIHAIKAQILPNLRFLLDTVKSGGVNAIDQSGKPDAVSWVEYLNRKIASWERTLAWASPEDVSSITEPFTSDNSVYGDELQEKMDGDGGYNELFNAESDYSSVATQLAKEWTVGMGIDLAQATPMFAVAAFAALTGKMFPASLPLLIFQTSLFGPSAFIQEARILPYIRADFDDTPVEGSENEGNIAYTSSSIVHPQARSAEGNPNFNDKLRDTEGEVFYSFGMSDRAASDMDSWSSGAMKFDGTSADVSEDAASALEAIDKSRILASLTGGTGAQGMANGDDSNPPDSEILLSFSGGGQALEFTFKSDDEIEDYNSHVAFEIDGEVSFSGGYHQDAEISAGIGVYWDDNAGLKYGWNRDFRHDRMFIWSKRGHVVTKYSLADPEFGDKFVISVSSDRRFGTPVFSTKGGRSMCPGELGTVFRESGVYTEIPLKTKMNTENLNPGQRAIFEVVIKNESPYREAGKFALRLVDGLQSSINEIVAAAYAKAGESEHVSAADVVQEVTKTAQSTIAKDSHDVSRLKTAASDESTRGGTAQSVADAVYSASTTAPREATELGDSTFLVNGNRFSVGDYMPLKFIGGDALSRQKSVSQMYLNLAIEPGFATRRIDYLQLRLQSLCETKMWEGANLYREPISFTQNVDPMSWSQPCPKVQFDESTISKYLYSSQSPSSSGELNLKVNNPDQYVLWPDDGVTDALMNERLKLVRLQYRPVSGGEWITAKDEGSPETDKKFNLLCADSRTEGCKFDWVVNNQREKLLSGFKDNVYELRLKNFCFDGPSLADPSVHEYVGDQRLTLTVDTKRPMIGRIETTLGRFANADFDEHINCDAQKVEMKKVRTRCGESGGTATNEPVSEEALRGTFEFKCTNFTGGTGRWTVEFPDNERGRYVVKVDGVTDTAGNAARSFELTVDAHCSLASSTTSDGAALLGAHGRNAPSSAKSGDFATGWRDVRASVSMGTVASFVVVVGAAVVVLRRRRDGHADAQMESNKPLYDKEQHASGGYGTAL